MKAIILNKAGEARNLTYADVPDPIIREEEVLIRVHSLSINPVDLKARGSEERLTGFYGNNRPVILGWDLSGTIEEVGKSVSDFKVGDEVFGMVNFPGNGSAYAEYVAAPTSHITLKPDNISHPEAAAATLAALTAWQALVTNGKIKKDDKVLIHAASGGVGHYALQLARHFGAFVIGTSSAKNKDFVMKNGAEKHIDYTTKDFENEIDDVDFVLDAIGKDITARSVNITRKGGKVISILGNSTPANVAIAESKEVELSNMLVQSSATDMKSIADLMQKGIIKSHVSQTFLFREMVQAHLQLETGRTVGKIIINL